MWTENFYSNPIDLNFFGAQNFLMNTFADPIFQPKKRPRFFSSNFFGVWLEYVKSGNVKSGKGMSCQEMSSHEVSGQERSGNYEVMKLIFHFISKYLKEIRFFTRLYNEF